MSNSRNGVSHKSPGQANETVQGPDLRVEPGSEGDAGDDHPGARPSIPRRVASGDNSDGDSVRCPPKRLLPPIRKLPSLRPRDHGPLDDKFADKFPFLASYLYRGSWDDLQPREASTLTIKAVGGSIFLGLKCPTEGQEVAATGSTMDAAMRLLERYCETGSGPWKDMKWGTGAQKSRDLRKKEVDKRRSITDD